MQTEIVIAGFGGQGTLFAGQVLAYAGMDSGKTVTWIPSYGPEMRGGTANCTVIIADEEIGSPLVRNPKAAIVLNLPSLDKYEPLVAPGGVLIANASLINRGPARTTSPPSSCPPRRSPNPSATSACSTWSPWAPCSPACPSCPSKPSSRPSPPTSPSATKSSSRSISAPCGKGQSTRLK